ncbi:MAG: LacI family transcriptional regulator, partial [Anaerolineae bacterium]|nr:LacI family transcriptional regulator [Anaerolineae bacterium]
SRQVDGVVWAVPGHVSVFEWLADRFGGLAVPTVFLNKRQDSGQQVVAMDNRFGAKLAVEHLLGQGFRRIGIIKGPEG